MKKKICPYCDQVMKNPGYCGFCHRIVLHPGEQEVNYYLNERHPAVEEDCLYHGPLHEENIKDTRHVEKAQQGIQQDRNAGSGQDQPKPVPKGQQRGPKQFGARAEGADSKDRMPVGQMRSMAPTRLPGNEKKKKSNPISVIVMVYMIVVASSALIKNFDGFERKAETAYISEISSEETAVTLNDWERTAEQVKEAGIPCNTYGHLDVDTDMVIGVFQTEMENAGYSMEEYYSQSDNVEQGDYRYYNTGYTFDLVRETEWAGMLQLYFDTATDQMHGMQLIVDNDQIGAAAEGAFASVKDLGLLPAETDTELLLKTLIDGAKEYNMSLSEQEGLEISMRIYEEDSDRTYTLMIYGKGYLTDAEGEI